MWIFTAVGFFSAVCKPGSDVLTVRARVAGDLDRLRERYLLELSPTVAGTGTDYPYRATVDRKSFAEGLAAAARDIDYGNFKDAIAATQGYERAAIYGRVWGDLLALEAVGEV